MKLPVIFSFIIKKKKEHNYTTMTSGVWWKKIFLFKIYDGHVFEWTPAYNYFFLKVGKEF